MPPISNIDDESENSKKSPGVSKILSGKEHNSSEFRAEIIPYDNLEDPNAPILAFSGDNLNLIFNIPKERFRKLAVAAIDHLDQDSNNPPEKSTSSYNKSSSYNGEMSSSNVKDLDITDTYEENGNDSHKSEIENGSIVDEECGDSVLLKDKMENLGDKSVFNNRNNDAESATSEEPLNGVTPASSISGVLSDSLESIQHLSIDEKLKQNSKETDSVKDDKFIQLANGVYNSKMQYREDEGDGFVKEKFLGSEKIQKDTFVEEQRDSNQNDASEKMNFSEYSLGLCNEDCPEAETVWPVIERFTETENIPLKELTSKKLNGVLTKFLKLEFSREFIVLQVSSQSDFLVNAARYKEKDSASEGSLEKLITVEHDQSEERSSNSFICDMCKKSSVGGNLNERSIKDSSNLAKQSVLENSMLPQLENEYVISKSSNLSDNELADEPLDYGSPIKGFGTSEFQKSVTLKLEQKLKEPNESIPGNSPTERLKYVLNDGLKKSCSKREVNTQAEELISGSSKVLDGSEAEDSLVKNSDETDEFQTLQNELEGPTSQSFNENSGKSCGFYDKIKMPQETDQHSDLSKPESRLSPSFCSSPDDKASTSVLKEPIDTALEMPNKSDDSFTAENFLGDANDSIEIVKNKGTRDSFDNKNDSLEDSGLHNSLCSPVNGVSMNVSIQFENNKENEELDSGSKLENSLCEIKAKQIFEIIENKAPGEVNIMESTESLKNEVLAEAVKNSDCGSKTTVNDIKSEKSRDDKFEEIVAEEECLSKDISETESIDETLKGNLNTDETIPKKNLENSSGENKLECSETKSRKSDGAVVIEKIAEILQSEKLSAENKHEQNTSLESHLNEDMKENEKSENTYEENAEKDELNETLKNHSSEDMKNEETENISEDTNAEKDELSATLETHSSDVMKKEETETISEEKNAEKDDLNATLENHSSEDMKNEATENISEERNAEKDELNATLETHQSADMKNEETELSEEKDELNLILETHSSTNMKNDETENISEEIIADVCEVVLSEASDFILGEPLNEASKSSENESYVEHNSECLDLVQNITDSEVNLPENSFASSLDSFMDKTVDTFAENMSEAGDLENDDAKSVTSESDSKDSEKLVTESKDLSPETEVDCGRTRTKRKVVTSTKDAIPEAEVKSDTFAESTSEVDIESDDIKSVASESDDGKDGEKRVTVSKGLKKKKPAADEVDCAPTRVRRKKVDTTLTNDVIPENSEVKNIRTSKFRDSALNVSSKTAGKLSPVGRNLRSKSLDPTPQPSQGTDKKRSSAVESEEINRRTRAKTPDVIGRKDIKTASRSSPRKLVRSATTESNTASKVQSTKTKAADKSQNLDSPMSTSRRSKR